MHAALKGTSLFCYHRQEDVEANVEPALTIAINKVSDGIVGKQKLPGVDTRAAELHRLTRYFFYFVFFSNTLGSSSSHHKESVLWINARLNVVPPERV